MKHICLCEVVSVSLSINYQSKTVYHPTSAPTSAIFLPVWLFLYCTLYFSTTDEETEEISDGKQVPESTRPRYCRTRCTLPVVIRCENRAHTSTATPRPVVWYTSSVAC